MSKGLHPSWYAQKLKELEEFLAKYELDIEDYYSEFWVFKVTYFGKHLFDYYPKSRKVLRISKKKNRVWVTLNEDYIEHFKNICEGYLILGTVDVNFNQILKKHPVRKDFRRKRI